MTSDPLAVTARVATVFDRLSVPYLVGGSLASSVYGIPRTTQDVDFVADLESHHVKDFTADLAEEFYVHEDMVLDAINRKSSFNVVHLATMFKVDIFIFKGDAWAHEEMNRARIERVEAPGGPMEIRFSSPEDTLLYKLVWYRPGNGVSERQWSDVLGILKVQARQLDHRYLRDWAEFLGVADLLARACTESGQATT